MTFRQVRAGFERYLTPEVLTFLFVGGMGYVIDVAAFNVLRSPEVLGGNHPVLSRVVAVALAMVVTYAGNRTLTWRDVPVSDRRREVALFIVFNVIGLGFSVVTLVISHDVMGLTSRLADNISANVIGMALGTVFRYWSYKKFVFTGATATNSQGVVEVSAARAK